MKWLLVQTARLLTWSGEKTQLLANGDLPTKQEFFTFVHYLPKDPEIMVLKGGKKLLFVNMELKRAMLVENALQKEKETDEG
jgi:hypothetical protein